MKSPMTFFSCISDFAAVLIVSRHAAVIRDLVFSVSIPSPLGSWEEDGAQLAFRLVGDDRVRNRLQTARRGRGETERSWE